MKLFRRKPVDGQVTSLYWRRTVYTEREVWVEQTSSDQPHGGARNMKSHQELYEHTVSDPNHVGGRRTETRSRSVYTFETLEWVARGLDYREAFQHFQPGFDLDDERARRAADGQAETFGEAELYPDTRPALQALQEMGIWVGVAGNQTSRAGAILRSLSLPASLIATSDDWNAAKPDPSFFHALLSAVTYQPHELVYVGDRIDNDLKPAKAAGLLTAFIRRGPWGHILERHPDLTSAANWTMETLTELPELIRAANST
jgi:HAD superfamily hydrolase (TIGR01549 family)